MTTTSRPLHRLRHNRLIGGVCSGIAEYLGLSTQSIRIATLILTLFAGVGVLLYTVLWIIIPLQSAEEARLEPIHPPHRLYRCQHNKMIAGVCSGIARALNLDPTVIRLCFVAASLFAGSAIFIYLILWLVMPLKINHSQ